MQAFLIWKLCFSEHFSSGFEPKYPNQGRRLPSSWRGSRDPLPCLQGHRWLRLGGFCFSTVLPILSQRVTGPVQGQVSLLNSDQGLRPQLKGDSSREHPSHRAAGPANAYKRNLNSTLKGPCHPPFKLAPLQRRKSEEKAVVTLLVGLSNGLY